MFRRLFILLLVLSAALAAGWLALRRADIPYDSLEAKYAAPGAKFLTLESGLKVHYRDEGNKLAPAIVLVHGFSSSLHTWNDWADGLKSRYRVIRFDLPGHGLTRVQSDTDLSTPGLADFVQTMADVLKLETFTLVGSSMGGHTAWNYAITYPDRLDALVLVAASGLPSAAERDNQPLIFSLIRNPITGPLLVDLDITPLIRDGLEKSFVDQSKVTDDMVDRYVELARAPGHRKALLQLATRAEPDTGDRADQLYSLKVPTLIMFGDQDLLVPPEFGDIYKSRIEGSQLITYRNVGHLPQEEIPDQSLADLMGFLDTLAAKE